MRGIPLSDSSVWDACSGFCTGRILFVELGTVANLSTIAVLFIAEGSCSWEFLRGFGIFPSFVVVRAVFSWIASSYSVFVVLFIVVGRPVQVLVSGNALVASSVSSNAIVWTLSSSVSSVVIIFLRVALFQNVDIVVFVLLILAFSRFVPSLNFVFIFNIHCWITGIGSWSISFFGLSNGFRSKHPNWLLLMYMSLMIGSS